MECYNVKITEFKNEIRITTYNNEIIKNRINKKINNNIVAEVNDIVELGYFTDQYIANKKKKTCNEAKAKKDSISRAIQKCYNLGKANEWEYFITLTFNKEKVDRQNYDEVTKKLSKWLNNAKKSNPNMKYLAVPELHKKDKAYHFHLLASNIPNVNIVDSGYWSYGKYIVNKEKPLPKWVKNKELLKTIYNIDSYNLGFSTSTKIEKNENAVGYILKYLNEDIANTVPIGKKKYWASKNLDKPKEEFILINKYEKKLVKINGRYKNVTVNKLNEYIENLKKSNPKYHKEIIVDNGDYSNKINIIEFNK